MVEETCEDIKRLCIDCGLEFCITIQEQFFFASKNLSFPKRCKECRKRRKVVADEQNRLVQADVKAQEEVELKSILQDSGVRQIEFQSLTNETPKNTLFVVGNGFDIMHGVPSSYWDFQKTLGKRSEIRYHLENYLNVKSDDLWYNLEDSLSHINAGVMLDVIDMWLDVYDVYKNNAESMADLHCAIDDAMLPIQVITHQLPRRFRMWVESLVSDGSKPCAHLLSSQSIYLNFNYTEFLEDLYEIPKENIEYIHGCRKREKGKPKEKLILGHVPNVDYLKEYKPNRSMVPHYKNPRKREILEYAIDVGLTQWITYYEQVFTKHTPDIIKEKQSFFNKIDKILNIIVIGHSLSEVDYSYFEEIVKHNKGKAFWRFGYHSLRDLKNILSFAENMKIEKNLYEVFRT